MKSNLFSIADMTDSESFSKDFKLLFELDAPILAKLPQYALEALEAPTRAETYNVHERAAEELGVPQSRLNGPLSIVRFFLRESAPRGEAESDSAQVLVDDLKELFGLPQDKTEAVRSMLEDIRTKARDKVQLAVLRRGHAEKSLPTLESVSIATDIRAIFDEVYEYDKDVSHFAPKFMGTIPMGIIELTLADTRAPKVFFQVNKRTLQVLMDYLRALRKQIDIAEKHINTKKG